jgi:hypothetical protein
MNEAPRRKFSLLTPKGEAVIVVADSQNVTLHAPFPSPPGSPLQGILKDSPHEMRVKVHGCRALEPNPSPPSPEGKCFEITGRWVNLSKDARELLSKS